MHRCVPGIPARSARHLDRFALAATVVLALTACSRPAAAPEPIRAVRTLTVMVGPTGGAIDYAAEVRPRSESRLAFRVGGKLVSRPVGLGDAVKAGQVLARLDPQDLRLGQEAAQSSAQAAQVQQAQALADFKRFKELREQGFISAADLERRESTLKAAQAQLEQTQALADLQANQLRYSALLADVGGVVTSVDAEPGAVLTAGTTVLRVAQDGPRDVVFSVPEDQVAGLRSLLGRRGALQVRLWGGAAAPLAATVREVAAEADAATRTFVVKADVGSVAVRLGQTATVSIALPPLPGAITLPLTALFERQGRSAVWLLDRATMTVREQVIAVAGADGNAVIVGAGLVPGQTVVTAGVHTLNPGQKVSLYGAADASAPASSANR